MSLVRKVLATAALVFVAGGLSLGGALSASADSPAAPSGTPAQMSAAVQPADTGGLHRFTCGNRTDFLWIFSDATTCWANSGTANVNLYNVTYVRGGANSGYIYQPTIAKYTFFSANQTKFGVSPSYYVDFIDIY
jgi:hypothetical protein